MKIVRMKSLMLTLLAMMTVGMMCVSLTACDDDDDNGGGGSWPSTFSQAIKYNGVSSPIVKAMIVEDEYDGVEYYIIRLYTEDDVFRLSVPKKSLDKTLDLTKDQSVSESSPVTVYIEDTYAYGDESFSAGSTLRVSIKNGTLKVVAKGKALVRENYKESIIEKVLVELKARRNAPVITLKAFEPYTFDIQYSGAYTKEEIKEIIEK